MKTILLMSMFILMLSSGFSNEMISGSYPGEIFTNGIAYYNSQDSEFYYGFGYSPDFGRHFAVTMTITDQLPQNFIHGIDYMGEFYLHDANNGYIFRMRNFGATFAHENTECEEIDRIEPGAGREQLFLVNNTDDGCYFNISSDGGSNYTQTNYFPQVEIKPMAYERESRTIYLLGYDHEDDLVYLFVSVNNGQRFHTYVLDAQLQTLDADLLYSQLLPTPDGTIYILMATYGRDHRLYKSNNNLQNCELVWQYTPLIYETIDMLWTGVEGAELLRQSYYWHMAYSRLEYFTSSDDEIDFQSVALYNFHYPYQNPVFLVPTAGKSELYPEAGSVKLHVRSNADWQISCDANWVSGFSQVSGNNSADVLMNYQANTSGIDRSCIVHFQSTAAPDTALVITQLGNVSADDEINVPVNMVSSYPNPFHSTVNIHGKMPHNEMIEIKIYNIRGELVRVLNTQSDSQDEFTLAWDAKDNKGKHVASGVYLCKVKAGNTTQTQKLVCW